MSMPISPNVPVQPSLRISNGENEPPCPTNMPPPAPTAVPLGERSVNAVRAPAVPAARTLTLQEQKEVDKAVKKARATCEKERKIVEAHECSATAGNSDMKPAFRVGDYVKVKGDTSPGHNRPDGYAFVE
jgi:hypothetical protein